MPAALALDHPFGGLCCVMVDRNEDVSPKEATAWLRDELLPGRHGRHAVGAHGRRSPRSRCPRTRRCSSPPNPGEERRTLLLCFLECDPRECWDVFAGLGDAVAGRRPRRRVSYAAPFLPTIPGTDTYTDQLW